MNEFRDLWQKQEVEEVRISLDELRAKAAKFRKRIRQRNLGEHVACVVVAASFGAMGIKGTETIPRIACALIVVAAVYIAWHLQVWGKPKAWPGELRTANSGGFYRRELERQRDLLSSIWKWYLGPLIPGMAMLIIYGIVSVPASRRVVPVVYAIAAAAFIWAVGRVNQRAAQKLNRQIAELDRDLGA